MAAIALLVLTLAAQTIAATTGAVSPAASETRRVVLLYDERTDLPGLASLDASLVQSITSGPAGSVEVYREAMDLSRFGSDAYLQLLGDHLRAKYAAKKIDVVVAVMGPALDFLLRQGDLVFPGTPIVFCGIDRREIEGRALPGHVTGVLVKREFSPTLQVALRLHPDTTRVVFVGGTSEFDLRLVEQAREEFRSYEDRLAFTYVPTGSLRALLADLAHLPPQTLVLYSTLFRDGAGEAFVPHEVAERVTAAANVPVYGFVDQYLGRGIVGGQLYSLDAHGKQAADLVRQILAGQQPSQLPLRDGAAGVALFDWRQLRRWGISESQLPAGSAILYRQLGAWELYRPQVIGAILLVLLQSAFIAALLVQRTHRLRVERARKESEDALRESQQRYTLASAAGAVGVWDWNLETSEVYVDPTLKSILGFDNAAITIRAEEWGARVHVGDVALVTAAAQACIDGSIKEYDVEHRMIHTDGSVRWFLSRGSLVRRADGTPHRMVGTKVDITERKQAEEAMRENEAVLQASHREIQDLAGRLIVAQEVERARIARDLHDDLSQQLAGLSIALSGVKRRAGALPGTGDLQGDLSSLQQRTLALAENIRHLSHDLHPSVLEHAGLVAALSAYCAELQSRHTVTLTFSVDGEFDSTGDDVALCLYRVAQEALRNVVTHADARHAEVRLRRVGDRAELTIADDGKGFEIVHARRSGKGLGLVSIQERARLAGGTVSIVTELHKGTRVRVQVPTNRSASDAAAGEAGPYATTA